MTREVRSSELPNATVNLTAVEPHEDSRIAAGALNNPVIYERAAGGVSVFQLITDFGRSRNLVASAQLQAEAQVADQQASVQDIILAADTAFYSALRAQALLDVAQQTVATRQTTADQVQALTNAKLKSELDLSFANVNLAQAKLLLLDAQNQKAAAFANLNAVLGNFKQQPYSLVDEAGSALPPPPANADALLELALRSRPDLRALEERYRADERFRHAEHDLSRPTIAALGAVGDTPIRADQLSPWYGAVGVNVSIPVFNGFLFSARMREADFRSRARAEQLRDMRDRVARDVQVTCLQSQSTFERIAVTSQLLEQANLALDLATERYRLGLSSIVEVSQAQLQQTQAAIDHSNARYDYLSALASLNFQTGQILGPRLESKVPAPAATSKSPAGSSPQGNLPGADTDGK